MAVDIRTWLSLYESPESVAEYIDKAELKAELENMSKDILIVDLRSTDFEDGNIKGSINIPAQSVYGYGGIGKIVDFATRLNVSKVVVHCNSSKNRATKFAGWFEDYVRENNISGIKALVLTGGIRAWIDGGDEYTALMEGYNK